MKDSHLIKQDYDDIKKMVGMRQASEFYGYQVDRQGRCLCPFHNDRKPSMKIYPHDKGYYCFSCGAGGDVITFVSRLYGLDNESAAKKIIEDFALPIKTDNLSYREKREREQAVKRQREMQGFIRYAEGILKLYRIKLCEAIRDINSPHFSEGLQMLSIVDYWIDCMVSNPQKAYADKKVVKRIGAVEQRLVEWDAVHHEGSGVSG